jgi:hypothetical protein
MEFLAVPGQHSVMAQRRCGQSATIPGLNLRQGLSQIGFVGQPHRNIPTGNQEVDLRQEQLAVRVKIVEVCDHRNVRLTRSLRCLPGRRRIVPVHMKSARIDDPFATQLLGQQRQPTVAFPKDRALACAVHEDERLLTRDPRRDGKMCLPPHVARIPRDGAHLHGPRRFFQRNARSSPMFGRPPLPRPLVHREVHWRDSGSQSRPHPAQRMRRRRRLPRRRRPASPPAAAH